MENSEENKCRDHLQGKKSRLIIEEENCTIVKDPDNPPLFLLGFTGAGLIGTIIANELIDQLKMKQIGYVLSEDLPPMTVFYDGILKHPFRIYLSEEHNLIVSICEVPFVQGSYTDLARTLMGWALRKGLRDIVLLQGLADRNFLMHSGEIEVFAAGEKGIMEKIIPFGVQIPPKGIIMGAEAAVLNECLNNRLNGIVFLTSANPQMPSPEGSAAILSKLGEIYALPVNTDELDKAADEIKQKLFELAQKSGQMQQVPGSVEQSSGPRYDFYS